MVQHATIDLLPPFLILPLRSRLALVKPLVLTSNLLSRAAISDDLSGSLALMSERKLRREYVYHLRSFLTWMRAASASFSAKEEVNNEIELSCQIGLTLVLLGISEHELDLFFRQAALVVSDDNLV